MTEREDLLKEIKQLESEINKFTHRTSSKQHPIERPTKRQRVSSNQDDGEDSLDIQETIRALLTRNDSALSAAHTPKGKVFEEEGDEVLVQLERAYEEIQANSAFTGVEFSRAESRLLSSESTHQLRQHTIAGSLPSPVAPLSFRINFVVREPTHPEDPDERGVDPGREYVLQSMEADVLGGGDDLQEAIQRLNLTESPNPPALFALLRQYSLLASRRIEMFAALREQFSNLVSRIDEEDAEVGTSVLSFANETQNLQLDFIFRLLSYSSNPSLLAPQLTLMPILSPSLRSSLREQSLIVLEEIPGRFEELVREGMDPEQVVGVMLKAVFGEM